MKRALSKREILRQGDFYIDVQLWPAGHKVNLGGWLSNFTQDEMPYAIALADSFIYLSEPVVDASISGGVRAILSELSPLHAAAEERDDIWRDFVEGVWVTFPEDENPNVVDSGHIFVRKARQVLGLPESRIMAADDLAKRWKYGRPPRHILFLDDFLGSGDQMVKTWTRDRDVLGGKSIAGLAKECGYGGTVWYVPVLSTANNVEVEKHCPGLRVLPVNLLGAEYSANNHSSIIWPEELRAGAEEFVKNASARAGIAPKKIWGYGELALAVAFYHSVPDATLPLLHHRSDKWTPLIPRT